MKLSEAIRLGAMIRPQTTHEYMNDGKSCAIGAALEAIGVPLEDRGDDWERKAEANAIEEFMNRPEYKEWAKINVGENKRCPVCGEYRGSVTSVIIDLNNYHKWTRERIADWVESIEPAEPVEAVKVETVEHVEA